MASVPDHVDVEVRLEVEPVCRRLIGMAAEFEQIAASLRGAAQSLREMSVDKLSTTR